MLVDLDELSKFLDMNIARHEVLESQIKAELEDIENKYLKEMMGEIERSERDRDYDKELAHRYADEILCRFLSELGYVKIVAAFHSLPKWYA